MAATLKEQFAEVYRDTGLDLSLYDEEGLRKRLSEVAGSVSADLADFALVNDTVAFRRAEYTFSDPWEVLYQHVVQPLLTQSCLQNRPVEIWVPGCSTGEELWSHGALFYAATNIYHEGKAGFRIAGTDFDSEALSRAERSVAANAFAFYGMVPEFLLIDAGRVGKELDWNRTGSAKIASHLSVRKHNLLDSERSGPQQCDLISCTNLMRHLNGAGLALAISSLDAALKPGGFLFIDASDRANLEASRLLPYWPTVGGSELIFQKM